MNVVVSQFDGLSSIDALPLAAGVLVASARRDRRLRDTTQFSIRKARLPLDETLAAIGQPDVLACSTYVWNERYTLEVARRVHAARPGTFVLVGGPSVPRRPDHAARFLREHPYVHALALGEGELLFPDLLDALSTGRPLHDVPGLALRPSSGSGNAILTAARDRIVDFSEAGSPYLDGSFDALCDAGRVPGAAVIETNRGCPFRCTFCDWGQAVGTPVRELPFDRLAAELAWIAERRIPYLYIIDANYGMRRRDIEIIREIARLKADTGFPQYVFFHLTKNATARHLDLVFALRDAGIGTHLALSAQDFEPRVLRAVQRENISLDRALALRRDCHERGIPTFNELILGLPEQTYESFAESMERAVTPYPLDSFTLYLARLLENSEMASPLHRAQYGIDTRHVPVGAFHRGAAALPVPELEEVVVGTRTLPEPEWRRAFKLGYVLVALHSLRLLDVVIQAASCVDISVRRFVDALLARAADAPPSSAFGRIDATLERYATAVVSGEAMVLPARETGDHLWAVEDAVVVAAVASRGRFFDETASFVQEAFGAAEGSVLSEAVRYQRLVTPVFGGPIRQRIELAFDFVAWRNRASASEECELPRRRTSLRWSVASDLAVAGNLRAFALGYLDAVHARRPMGRFAPRRRGSARPRVRATTPGGSDA